MNRKATAPAETGEPSERSDALATVTPASVQLRELDTLSLDRLLDLEVSGWRPEPGDKVVGKVVNVEIAGQGSPFGAYPLLTIVTDDTGEIVNVHAFHTVLRAELGRKLVGTGDRVGIKYLGVKDGGSFGTYENYRVIVQGSDPLRLSAETVSRDRAS